MSIEYTIEPSEEMVVITARGRVSMTERYEFSDRLAMDENLPARVNALVDVRGEEQSPSEAEIRWIVMLLEHVRLHFARRVAFLTLPENRVYEVIAAFAGDSVGGVKVFDNERDARMWLKQGAKAGPPEHNQ